LREICKIVNSKAKDLENAWPEDVQQSKISQENLKKVRKKVSLELFHPLRSVQYNNKTEDLIDVLQSLSDNCNARYCPTDNENTNSLSSLLNLFRPDSHNDVYLNMITTDFEYITMDAGGHTYKLKPETQLRKAFCKEFVKIYKRNEKETNVQSQDIVKTLNEIAIYLLNFDLFSFVDDDLPSNYQTASATKKDNPAAVKGDGECKQQLAEECKDALELVEDISIRHKVINEAIRKNHVELRKIITGRNAEELAKKLHAKNAIKRIRFDEVEEVQSSAYQYSNALLDTFTDGLVQSNSLPVLLDHLNNCEFGDDLANKIMDDVKEDVPLAIKGTGVYCQR